MALLNVQFYDEKQKTIISYFGSPNDPEVWPNQGKVQINDPRWADYWNAQPLIARQMLPAPTQ